MALLGAPVVASSPTMQDGQGGSVGLQYPQLLFVSPLSPWTWLLLPLPSMPPLLSPASPLTSDLDLFLPWEAQGQSLEVRVPPRPLGPIF